MTPNRPIFLEDFRGSYADFLVPLYMLVSFLSTEIILFNNAILLTSSSSFKRVISKGKTFAQGHMHLILSTVASTVNSCMKVDDVELEATFESVVTSDVIVYTLLVVVFLFVNDVAVEVENVSTVDSVVVCNFIVDKLFVVGVITVPVVSVDRL